MKELLMMILTIVSKGVYFLLFFSTLYTLRHFILFSFSVVRSKKYEITKKELKYVGIAVSIILTIIFSGIKLF